jgi:hypothetical protein
LVWSQTAPLPECRLPFVCSGRWPKSPADTTATQSEDCWSRLQPTDSRRPGSSPVFLPVRSIAGSRPPNGFPFSESRCHPPPSRLPGLSSAWQAARNYEPLAVLPHRSTEHRRPHDAVTGAFAARSQARVVLPSALHSCAHPATTGLCSSFSAERCGPRDLQPSPIDPCTSKIASAAHPKSKKCPQNNSTLNCFFVTQ